MKLLQQGDIDYATSRIAVVGTFDGVHRGHRFLLDYMKAEALRCNLEPTVITFAQHPLSVIKPQALPPQLTTTAERISLLEANGVECCIMMEFNESFRQLTARQFLDLIHRSYGVKKLVVGFDTRFGKDCVDGYEQYREIGKEVGIEVVQAPKYGSGISSSEIRTMLLTHNIAEANEALGHRYSLEGVVVGGKQIGRTIGFPTANIEVADSKKLIPSNGVYAVDAIIPHLGEKRYRAMLNIGRRPTIDNPHAPISIEAHIIDFEGDIYGKTLRLEFLDFIRHEQRFASLEQLTEQIQLDRLAAINICSQGINRN